MESEDSFSEIIGKSIMEFLLNLAPCKNWGLKRRRAYIRRGFISSRETTVFVTAMKASYTYTGMYMYTHP